MSGRGDRGASREVKCQAGWYTKGQAQGKQRDLQIAFLQDNGFPCLVSMELLNQNYMLQNALLLLVAGQQHAAMLSPHPAL